MLMVNVKTCAWRVKALHKNITIYVPNNNNNNNNANDHHHISNFFVNLSHAPEDTVVTLKLKLPSIIYLPLSISAVVCAGGRRWLVCEGMWSKLSVPVHRQTDVIKNHLAATCWCLSQRDGSSQIWVHRLLRSTCKQKQLRGRLRTKAPAQRSKRNQNHEH